MFLNTWRNTTKEHHFGKYFGLSGNIHIMWNLSLLNTLVLAKTCAAAILLLYFVASATDSTYIGSVTQCICSYSAWAGCGIIRTVLMALWYVDFGSFYSPIYTAMHLHHAWRHVGGFCRFSLSMNQCIIHNSSLYVTRTVTSLTSYSWIFQRCQ